MTKYTFYDLLEKKCFEFSKIEIPLLQRDYVQGQNDSSGELNKTGKNFISAIFESLKKNTPMDMDFIYGSVRGENFIPLDGQQRLTTLFLLHWYFAHKLCKGDELKGKLHLLSNFSYETRVSSREFCKELCNQQNSFCFDGKPSSYIRNEPWYFKKFDLDPTVSSMLNMLDEIYRLDKEENVKDYNKLNLLKFNILNLKHFGLTEELYLKMNARGKSLTAFEKFKAELEKCSDRQGWEKNVLFEEQFEKQFSYKIDRDWTDLFWDNFRLSIDNAFMNFVAETMIIQLTLQVENTESENGKRQVTRIQQLAKSSENLSVVDFNKENFDKLKAMFDLYNSNENSDKSPTISLWDYCKAGDTLFKTICKGEDVAGVTYSVRGLFYAQSLYLEKTSFDTTTFNDWMRVIRNIAKNATIDSVQTFKGFLSLIFELSAGCEDIYKYLATSEVKSNFAKNQVQEEIYKSKIIIKQDKAKELFSALEENSFCNGRLYFAFYCCNIDLQTEENLDLDLIAFEEVKTVFDEQFSNNISNDFRVLLFTCGENDFYEYWKSWSYGTKTHKRCCIESMVDLKDNFTRMGTPIWCKDILKEAVIKLTSGSSIRALLKNYKYPANMPEWKKWIIKNPDEFSEHCSGYYFGIADDNNECYLYEQRKRPSSREDCFKIPPN